jgi:hypothetical protein
MTIRRFLAAVACFFGFHKWKIVYAAHNRPVSKWECEHCGAIHHVIGD